MNHRTWTWVWCVVAALLAGGEPNTCPGGPAREISYKEVVCGNSVIESTEECDDGNTRNNDGCSSICKLEGRQE